MSDNPICVAVFGRTGSGKTSFIQRATGADIKVGNGAASTTKEIQRVEVPYEKAGGRRISLIDTPGFSDTDLEDPKLFVRMAKWLANAHNKEPLNGAILLQGINEVRVLQGEENGVKLFERIVGAEAFPQVMIITTMWDQVEQEFGEKNEDNRKQVWQNLKAGGAKFGRFYNTEDSALENLSGFLASPGIPFLLQKELVKQRGKVGKTSAGVFLYDILGTKIEDVLEQFNISGSRVLKKKIKKLRSWLKELALASIKFGASAWRAVVVTGTVAAARVWIWDT